MDTDLLTERLHHLGDAAPVPPTAPADDVRRGRRRLRRNRVLAVAGTATAVAALAGVGFAVTGSTSTTADRAAAPPAAGQPAPEGDTDEARLAGVLVGEVVESGGEYRIAYLLATAAVIEKEMGDRPWATLGVGEAPSWKASGAPDCPAGWTCEAADVKGASRAKLATDGTVSQVVAKFPKQVLVLSLSTERGSTQRAYTSTTTPDVHLKFKRN